MMRFLVSALVLLLATTAHAGGLSFVEYEQGVQPNTRGLRGARDVIVEDYNVYVIGEQDDAISAWVRDFVTNEVDFVEVETNGVGGVDGMNAPNALASTGSCIYVATADNPPGPTPAGAVVAFNRGGFPGGLGYLETKWDDTGGVDGIGGAIAIATSLDGNHVYVAGEDDHAIAVFSRTPPACALTFVSLVENGVGGVQGLERPQSVVVSSDGGSVYASGRILVAGVSLGTVVAFDRDSVTGALTYIEHEQDGTNGVNRLQALVSAIALSGDDENLYAASQDGDAVVAFTRDTGTGALTFLETERRTGLAKGFKGASGIVVSPFGGYVYVTGRGEDALAVFKRDFTTGTLDFLEMYDDPASGPNVLGAAEAVATALDFSGGVYALGSGPDTLVAFTEDRCGDGNRGADEQCDDGCLTGIANICEPIVDDGDGCSSTCRVEGCGPTITGTCHAATTPGGASLLIKDQSEDRKDQLKWNWKGEITEVGDFGNPVTTAHYMICVYDGSANPQPLLVRAAPAGGICNEKPCWSAKTTSFKYGDKFLTPDGVKKLQLKEGLVAGKAKVQVQGAGVFIDPPTLPLTPPVTVQVKNTQNGECWQSVFSTTDKNEAAQFKAKSQ